MFNRSITFLPAYVLLVYKLTSGKTSETLWGGLFLYCFLLFSSLNITVKDDKESWLEKGKQGLETLLWSTLPVSSFFPK